MNRFSSRRRHRRAIALAALALSWSMALSGRVAHAEIEVEIEALDPPQPTAKDQDPNPPPQFQARVKGAPGGFGEKDFELKQLDRDPAIQTKAVKVKKYPDSNNKMAMVILIQGNGSWMGNEMYYEGENAPQEGAFAGLGPALDKLKTAGPAGSEAAVLVYGDGKAEARMAMGDIQKLNASVLGSQRDYENKLDFPLLVGLKEALTIFDNRAGYRKILVVIGDGTGEREEIGTDLSARIEDLKGRKVEVYSIFYEAVESGQETGYQNMVRLGYTEHQRAASRENFATFAQSFVESINAVYYISFPGCLPGTQPSETTCFSHTGEVREFAVMVKGDEGEPVEVQTKQWLVPQPPEQTSLWWLWLLLVVVVVVIIAVIIVKRSQRAPAPPPMPFEVPQMTPPPEPVPAKTMMLGLGGTDDGVPIVGWIVPLNGPNQYQTFKLLQGATTIGSGGGANIIIQDGFMSTEHCQILASPSGFKLKDGGSTNGTYVNESRVSEHDLVDNDFLTMGKTNFKFKSIN
ncbi:MAG: FHA domain-containing protein [Proteobacteria bacterium]|nr:FHA domain-containing protein [Pseudomonadota bacterium]